MKKRLLILSLTATLAMSGGCATLGQNLDSAGDFLFTGAIVAGLTKNYDWAVAAALVGAAAKAGAIIAREGQKQALVNQPAQAFYETPYTAAATKRPRDYPYPQRPQPAQPPSQPRKWQKEE